MLESVRGFALIANIDPVLESPMKWWGYDPEAVIAGGVFLFILVILLLRWIAFNLSPSNRRAKVGGPTLEPRQIEEMMSGSAPIIIDLRNPQVFFAKPGHIRTAMNIPMPLLPREIDKLDPREPRPVILVDTNDELSHRAFLLLKAKGFGWVYVLKGGMKAWKRSGLPMYR